MPLYAMICIDHKGSLELRQKTRTEHLAYLRTQGAMVRVGGALLDEHGQPEGSLLILDCESQAAAETFANADPYAKAGLFSSVTIQPWRIAVGELA